MESDSKGIILAVDDNPENLGILFEYLDQSGFTVLLVQNSENALKQVERNQPDVVLLDVMMPGLNGFEVCQRLKAHEVTRDIPVIFMTALAETVDKVKGFEAGGVDYITKPIQCEEVEARVNAHLAIRRLQKELQEKNEALETSNSLLAQKNEQLQEANASKDRFFSIISHDLRTPFVWLLGLTQVMTEDFELYDKDRLKDMLVKLRDSSKNFYALLENLLTWSRIQCGMIEHHPDNLDIQQLISRNLTLFSSNAEQKQISLENTIQEQTPVYSDERMVETVMRNLISNALKFTNSGGSVTISATSNGNYTTIAVSDTGIGIREEHISKLFRIEANYKRIGTAHERGTGLGLILCKEFVEKNGGNIGVESEIGKGTTFRFTLPQKPME